MFIFLIPKQPLLVSTICSTNLKSTSPKQQEQIQGHEDVLGEAVIQLFQPVGLQKASQASLNEGWLVRGVSDALRKKVSTKGVYEM